MLRIGARVGVDVTNTSVTRHPSPSAARGSGHGGDSSTATTTCLLYVYNIATLIQHGTYIQENTLVQLELLFPLFYQPRGTT